MADLLAAAAHLGVLQLLSSVRPHLSAAEQAVASYLLEHPGYAAQMSAVELAQAAGVSEATIFRLCRELGYSGYAQLREELAQAVADYAPSFIAPLALEGDVAQHGEGGDKPDPCGKSDSRLNAMVYGGIRALVDALAVGDAAIEEAAAALCAGRRIILGGVGGYTGRIAEMAAFGLQRLGLTCMLWIDAQLSHVVPELFSPDDVVVGISYSGENRAVARLLEMAGQVGAKTISITNYRLSPVAKASAIALITSFREPAIQNFHLLPRLSQLLIVHTLIHAVQERIGEVEQRGAETAP